MRSPSLLSGPKIEGSNRKMLLHRTPLKSDFKGGHEVTFLDLKPQSRLYEFLVQVKVTDFSFDCLYFYHFRNMFETTRRAIYKKRIYVCAIFGQIIFANVKSHNFTIGHTFTNCSCGYIGFDFVW